MKWVTRSHVHVDRVACPWLISRFVDSDAEFFFVPASQVNKAAEELGATPFDAPGVELGHKDGKCSFETIIEHYGLTDKPGPHRPLRRRRSRSGERSAGRWPGSARRGLQPALPGRPREPGTAV
jgi:hypothetical protein